jgi:CHAT domain-containing protein/tetratricopeptide (TPR) repeat protein
VSLADSGFDAPAAAARWLDDADSSSPPALADAQTMALAWALKDAALASWASDPKRTQRCAALMDSLVVRGSAHGPALRAAQAWTTGIANLTRGEMAEAIACLDQARDALLAAGQAQRAAQSQIPKLIALTMLGRHDDAVQSAEHTLAAFVAAADELGAGKIEVNLGSMLLRQERYTEAAAKYKSAAVRFARARNAEHSVIADIGLANVLARQFQFDEAMHLFDRCAMRVKAHGLEAMQAVIDSNRGYLELRRGRYEHALPALVRTLERAETSDPPQERAVCQRELADAYLALSLLPEALALYDQVVSTFEALASPGEQAWAQVQRAQTLTRLGRFELAEADLRSALHTLTADANALGCAMVCAQLAALALRRGDAHGALAGVHDAVAVFDAAGVLHWQLQARLTQARALLALQRWDPARSSLERILSLADGLPDVAAAAHAELGTLLVDGAPADAARAEVHARQAMRLLESQQARLSGDEFKTAYGASNQAAYDLALRMAIASAGVDMPVKLLQTMEQSRGQALRAAVQQNHGPQAQLVAGLDNTRREQLHWLHNEWHAAVNERNDALTQRLRQRIGEIEQAWLEEQRRAQAAQPAGADHSLAASDVFDAAALQATLPEGTAWIEYALVKQRWAACVVTTDAVHAVQGDAHGLRERLAQLRFQIDTQRFGASTLRQHAPQMTARTRVHLQALHEQVWAPLAPLLGGIQRVIVSPHRDLHYLPFAALHDGQQWLVQRCEVQLAPSATIWLTHQQRQHSAPTPPQPASWRLTALGVGGDTLPHVRAEVNAVAAAFTAMGGQAVVHLDGQATQDALRAALPNTDVLHLACHGQFRADSPYFSALHLADGPLTLRDAASLPLQAQLVTLSACETGLSKVAPGDELLGLLRGFLMAGAPTVLSTLWTVDDAHTATLMGHFYRHLLAGQRPAAALRQAQCALIDEAPHPYHWAAFSIQGLG